MAREQQHGTQGEQAEKWLCLHATAPLAPAAGGY